MPEPIHVLLIWYVAFLVSTSLHEAAHAWAAMKGGDLTAYFAGQVSLDPTPHIRREPFGMLVLPLISLFLMGWPLGFASAPYDPRWADRHPRRAAWMALAGPGANFLLALIAMLIMWFGLSGGYLKPGGSGGLRAIVVGTDTGLWDSAGIILSIFFSLNLLLGVFNLLPMPPLDGSGALPLVLPLDTARRVQNFLRQPGVGLIGLIVAWNVFGSLFAPIFRAARKLVWIVG